MLKEYYNYSQVSTCIESSGYFWGTTAYVQEENFLCTRRKLGFNKKIWPKLTFPPQQQKMTQPHNCIVH